MSLEQVAVEILAERLRKAGWTVSAPNGKPMAERYHVAWGDSLNELLDEVNEMLAKGWQLQGGVSAVFIDREDSSYNNSVSYSRFFQAMTRYE